MNELTKSVENPYNKGTPIRCECGAVVAFRKGSINIHGGEVLVKCRKCKRIVNIAERAESVK